MTPRQGDAARAPRWSGRQGEFFTSVDTGPLFGELIAVQVAGVWARQRDSGAGSFDILDSAPWGAQRARLARHASEIMPARKLPVLTHRRHWRQRVTRRARRWLRGGRYI